MQVIKKTLLSLSLEMPLSVLGADDFTRMNIYRIRWSMFLIGLPDKQESNKH